MQTVVVFLVISALIGARSATGEGRSHLAVLGVAVLVTILLFNFRFV